MSTPGQPTKGGPSTWGLDEECYELFRTVSGFNRSFGFQKIWFISLLSEELLAFHEDFCSIEVSIVLSVVRSVSICGQDL